MIYALYVMPYHSGTFMTAQGRIRPVSLQNDLAPLADLIELVFAPTMDEGGRAAIREMRTLSRMGRGLSLLGQLNEMMLGIRMGYVWMQDGKLIGNVSLYPASLPDASRHTWIVANVAVHPQYQGRGIARQLMREALTHLAQKGGQQAILQVDYDNQVALHLYESLGFSRERAFTTWRRSSYTNPPAEADTSFFITRRTRSEWQQEYALAQYGRPQARGGIGWLKPTIPQTFSKSLWRGLVDSLTMNSTERLIVRTADEKGIVASLWIENNLGSFTTRLTLLSRPRDIYAARALLTNTVRRFRAASLTIEHPHDDDDTNALLRELRFTPDRTVYHMRLAL